MAKKSKAAQERDNANMAKNKLPERDIYTAKQVATRCGTDAKTLRKFLRSAASSTEPVGQGGRYEFDADQLPTMKKEFNDWRKNSESRRTSTPQKAEKKIEKKDPEDDLVGIDEVLDKAKEIYLADEPTEDELKALDLEFEDIDLDEDFDDEEDN